MSARVRLAVLVGLLGVVGLVPSSAQAAVVAGPEHIGSGSQAWSGGGNCTIQAAVAEAPDQSQYLASGSMPAVSSWSSSWSISCPGFSDIEYMDISANIGTTMCGFQSATWVNAMSMACPSQDNPAPGTTRTDATISMVLTNPNALYATWPPGCGASANPSVIGYVNVDCYEEWDEVVLPALP